jgi:putative ABC transport system permease protein
MAGDFFRLALSNIRRRKLRSWLTMIGIFIGIAAVVSLISLGQGLQSAVTGQFASLSTDKLTIQNAGTGFGPPGSTVVNKLNDHDVDVIKKVKGVDEIIPRHVRNGKVEFNKVTEFEFITSIPENPLKYELVYEAIGLEIDKGRLLKQGDLKKIIIGSSIADESEFGKEIKLGKKLKINEEEFEVVGILKPASTFTINQVIGMFEEEMKDLLDIGDEIDLIIVQVEDEKEIEIVAERIERALRNDRNLKKGEEDFSVETPLEAISAVNDILGSVNIVIVGIAMISLIVGGIGIANTMYTSVLERKKEIGTMKAVGAKNSDILSIFLIESGMLGFVGGIIGVIIGVSIALAAGFGANQAFGTDLIKVNISITLLISAATFSFLIGIFSGVVPSVQASKLRPVEALRG